MTASPPGPGAPANAAAPSPAGPGAATPLVTGRPVDAAAGGRQMRKLALSSEAGREYFETVCRAVQRVVLRPLRDGNAVEYAATLAGTLQGTSLMIDWPSDRDGLVPMRAGERVDVKFFSECDLVLFQVDVGLCCFRPRPYLHLDWPKEISVIEVRTVARIPMAKPAVFVRPAAGTEPAAQFRGTVVDLSLGGAALVSAHGELAVGELGEMLLAVHPDGGRVMVKVHPRCAIRSRRELPGADGFQYGIQFLEPSIDDRLVLLAIVGEAALKRED